MRRRLGDANGPRGARLWLSGVGFGLVSWLAAPVATVSGQSYSFVVYSVADGLAQSVVRAIYEDSRGYLWLGTSGGLSRWDGAAFVTYTGEDGLPHDTVNAIYESRDGELWLGTHAGAARFDGRRFTLPELPPEAAGARVLAITGDRRGRIWLGTAGAGATVIDTATVIDGAASIDSKAARPLDLGDVREVRAVMEDRAGDVWLGTEAGVYRLAGGEPPARRLEDPAADGPIEALFESSAGELWIATAGRGAIRRHGRGFERLGSAEGLESEHVFAIAEDAAGRIWLGTQEGLARYDGGELRNLRRREGLPADYVLSLHRDSSGILWAGTYGGGLAKLTDEAFVHYTTAQGLINDQVISIAEAPDGALWIAQVGGGVSRFDGERFESFTRADGLGSERVAAICVDRRGEVWIGTLDAGVDRYDGRTFTHYRKPDGLGSNRVFSIVEDRRGEIWIATWEGGVRRFDGGRFHALTTRDGLASDRVFSIYEDRSGHLWFSTREGVSRFDGTEVLTLTRDDGLVDDRVLATVEDRWGRHWFATSGGLSRWDGSSWRSFTRRSGLQSNNLYLLTIDRRDRLWVGSERGLARLELDAGGDVREIRHFGKAQGFLGVETNQNAVLEDRRGHLWVGTRGLTRFDPDEEPGPLPPPALHVTEVLITTGDELGPDGAATPFFGLPRSLELPHRQNRLEIGYAAIDLRAPSEVRYRYRLAGLEDAWSTPTSQRRAAFLGLPPGSYRFEVRARSARRPWSSQPAAFAFVVRPPFWSTWWFRGLAVVAATMAVLGLVAWRTTHLRRHHRLLEAEVEARTRELVAANQAKSDFLANMSHELRTPLNGVIGMAELLQQTRLSSDQEKIAETIRASGQALLAVIDDILDFSKIEARRLELEIAPVDLRDLVRQVFTLVATSAAEKGLRLESRVDERLPAYVAGDLKRLRQVLLNLVANAIKFTEEGSVTVQARYTPGAGDTGELEVSVADTGIGIAREKLDHLFDSFFQVDSSVSRRYGGSGLGLAICSSLVGLMGGRISVASEPGEGSTFTFTLPTRATEAPAEAARLEAASDSAPVEGRSAQRAARLLVAEDNPSSQLVISMQLRALGYEADLAADGLEVLEKMERRPYALVLMDCQMPKLDGYQTAVEIRRREGEQRRTVIVALTAHAMKEDRDRCLELGMDDYLSKPITVESLSATLERWLGTPAGADAAAG